MGDDSLVERLVLQLRDDVTKGFAESARATDLSRIEGRLQAYQDETDRRLEKLEVAENGRKGGWARWRVLGALVAFLASNGALWAGVLLTRTHG